MSLPRLPVVIDLKTVTAIDNGGAGRAEPYLLTVPFCVDGSTMKLVERPDRKLVLVGDPDVRETPSRHGNLPKIGDGETVHVPDNVGTPKFSLKPIALPGALGEAVVGGASGVAGLLYVLAEEDGLTDAAAAAGYATLVREFKKALRNVVQSVVVDPAAPGGGDPFAITETVKKAITEKIQAEVRKAILANTTLLQSVGLLNADDTLGSDILIYSEADLLARPAQAYSKRFTPAKRGTWRIDGAVTATIPADMAVRRRVTFDLDKLTCVTANDALPLGGDSPYLWNVFFAIAGPSVSLGENRRLSGKALVATSPGSHGNLGASGVRSGQVVQIPDAVGRSSLDLSLIPFPPSLRTKLLGGISGVVGCVSVLLERDLVTADAAEAGHQAFNSEVTRVLNELIPTLGVGTTTPGPAQLEALGEQIAAKVRQAILDEGNLLEDILVAADPDDVIGFKVLLFTHKQLLAQPQRTITATFGEAGRYDLTGSVSAVST